MAKNLLESSIMKRKIFHCILCIVLILLTGCEPAEEYIFPDVEGPNRSSELPALQFTPFQRYEKPGTNRLALLVNEEPLNWLAIAHALKAAGLPFTVTSSVDVALQHKVVFIYPEIAHKNWSPDSLKKIGQFVVNGGSLIAAPFVDGLKELSDLNAARTFSTGPLLFNQHLPDDSQWRRPMHDELALEGNFLKADIRFKLWSYPQSRKEALYFYDNGEPAIILNQVGKGKVLIFGFDLGELLSFCYSGYAEPSAPLVNHMYAMVDHLMVLIKQFYQMQEPNCVLIDTVPFGKSLSVIFTCNIESRDAVGGVMDLAQAKSGHPATYFIETRYMSDYDDSYFFDKATVAILKQAAQLKTEMASYTVAGSRQFYKFPIGSGREQYPCYRPSVTNRRVTQGGTVMGELRVSKFLLERLVTKSEVDSFRFSPRSKSLPQVLEATGYRYSSSMRIGNIGSCLPFQLNYDYGKVQEVDVFEFPIAIEQQGGYKLVEHTKDLIELAEKMAQYGAVCVVVLPSNAVREAVWFAGEFIDGIKEFSWFGTLQEYGSWWLARNEVDVEVSSAGRGRKMTLSIPHTMKGLVLRLPAGWQIEEGQEDRCMQQENRLIIEHSQPFMQIMIRENGGKK